MSSQNQVVDVPKGIHLIYEVNCYLGEAYLKDRLKLKLGLARSVPVKGYGSIWISSKKPNYHDYETEAIKLAGPLPSEEAMLYMSKLRAVLEEAGLKVFEETVSDD